MGNKNCKKIEDVLANNPKYQVFNNNEIIESSIGKNDLIFKDKNQTSIGFLPDVSKEIVEKLIATFDILNKETFREKFEEATSGDGHELLNMLTIWSSSLCALLCFYNVNANNPLTVVLDKDTYHFDKVFFEYKNKVFNKPSNVDIVLIDTKSHVFLFLESKFAEYLNNDSNKISETYYNYLSEKNEETLKGILKPKNIYHYGIKQLLSHYIGLKHFVDDEKHGYYINGNDERSWVHDFYSKDKENAKIFLQEIIFKNDETRTNEYTYNLTALIDILNDDNNKGKVTVLVPTTYQDFFSSAKYDGMDDSVKKFYKL